MKMKGQLGLALKKMMVTTKLDEISVINLTKECNVNRQTFYYHYRNIYDLLTWVFLNEEIEKPTNDELEEAILIAMRYIKTNRDFLTNTLQSAAKDLVRAFLFNYFYNINLLYLAKEDTEAKLDIKERKLLAQVYGEGIASSLIAWIEEEIAYSETEFVLILLQFFNEFPQNALKSKGETNA